MFTTLKLLRLHGMLCDDVDAACNVWRTTRGVVMKTCSFKTKCVPKQWKNSPF